jgi:isoquinoline 1-oxidoreductase subunit beta
MYIKPTLNPTLPQATRRTFLRGAAAASGLFILGTYVPFGNRAEAATMNDPPMPNAFIRIAPDDSVTVLVKHLDKGQGITTGLATVVAEELDADWAQMHTEFAPSNPALYNNLLFGPVQGTGGSTSMAESWMQLRRAAAAARAMLVEAAAQDWNLSAGEITVTKGVVSHAGGRSASFGALAGKAAQQTVPTSVVLKDPTKFTLIGTHVPRLDSVIKTTGTAIYSLDIKRPNMKTAVLLRPDRFGGQLKHVDDSAARAVPGVVDVVTVPQGVAVLATNTWAAIKGRNALKATWDDTNAETRSSDKMFADYKAAAATPGITAVNTGDAASVMAKATKIVAAEYAFPFLAHAPMEPLNCVIEQKPDGTVEVWAGAQLQTVEHMTVAGVLGRTPADVKLNTVWAGGSFGRRATPNADYFAEAAAIVKATGGKYPVHLQWTREDDIKGGRYRPMFYHSVKVALDAQGKPVAWQHDLVGQSFIAGTPFEAMIMKAGVDGTAVEGAADMPYAVPNLEVTWHRAASPVTTLWWRSVGHTHTAHAVEVMMDELAHAAGQDPVQYRLDLLDAHARHAAVLRLAAEKSGWGGAMPAGQGRGIAVHESFGSYVAMVAEVTVGKDGAVKVDRIVAAVDCGIAVNPDVIVAQVEGGAGYGLGAALRNKITFTDGKVDQANFDTYEPLRMSDMPRVEVHIVPSTENPTGIGEPGVPSVAPAVSNAIFAATGTRLRNLPFDFTSLKRV